MSESTRREFLRHVGAGIGAATVTAATTTLARVSSVVAHEAEDKSSNSENQSPSIALDFRYSPPLSS
jgi:hypothetical protein